MASAVTHAGERIVPRTDVFFAALAGMHGAALLLWPSIPLLAIGLWWNSNTISHNFIHRPFFRRRWGNRLFSAYLSLVLGFPQTLWRDRHLAHHAGIPVRVRATRSLVVETILILSFWIVLSIQNPAFLLGVYVPGYLAGLALCWLQGFFEHVHGTTSHYGALYNLLLFNDGYHVEHHVNPAAAWTDLPALSHPNTRVSRWPALLRWLDSLNLETLERVIIHSSLVQRWLVQCHRRAFAPLLENVATVRRVTIVGGALFPRTAIVLRELLPEAHLTIVDASAQNIETARRFVSGNVEFQHRYYSPGESADCDLLIVPLAFWGDRKAFYQDPPAQAVLVHDWIWNRRGASRTVSLALLKCVNLVQA